MHAGAYKRFARAVSCAGDSGLLRAVATSTVVQRPDDDGRDGHDHADEAQRMPMVADIVLAPVATQEPEYEPPEELKAWLAGLYSHAGLGFIR